jgi:hypothetical protein
MKCEEVRIRIVEELETGVADTGVAAHLAQCGDCTADAESIRQSWSRLAALPTPEARPHVAARFHEALDAYALGMRDRRPGWLARWWPQNPVWQIGLAAACLLLGFFAAPLVTGKREGATSAELSQLRQEMSSMRQLVTLSLLQQQSAAERLRGVTWSYRAEPSDSEVLTALLRTVDEDTNTDVRLAAVDALRNFGDSPIARKGLVEALGRQNSPLVQIAIVDLLAELREPEAWTALRSLSQSAEVNENVRKRAAAALSSAMQ